MSQLTADSVYRDYNTAGVPASGDHKPRKPDIRALTKRIMNMSGMSVTRNTFTALSGVTPPTENYMGVVLDDADPTKNGYYSRVAAAWVWERGFPDTLGVLESIGGTANAITASAATGVNPADLQAVLFTPAATNTSGTVTIAIDGGSAVAVKSAAGSALAVGDLVAGKGTLLFWAGAEWRQLFSSAAGATFDHKGDYAGGTTYTEGQVVTGSDGDWYQLKVASALGDDPVGSVTGNWLAILANGGGVADGAVTDAKVATPASAADGISAAKIRSTISSPSVHTALDVVLNGMSHIAVERFGVDGSGDAADMAAWQTAVEYGVPLYAGPNTYIINEGLYHETGVPEGRGLILAGAGQNVTRFDWRGSNEPMLTMNGYDPSEFCFQRGAKLSGFRIQPETGMAGTNAPAIYARAVWDAVYEQFTIQDISGYGIKYEGGVPPGDPDSSGFVQFNGVRIVRPTGYGMDFLSANNTVALAQFDIRNCLVNGQAGVTGVRIRGANEFRFTNNAVVACGVGGLLVDYNGTDNLQINIFDNEFGNGNVEYDVFIRSCRAFQFCRNIFTRNTGEAGAAGLLLGLTGEASNVVHGLVDGNRFRIGADAPYLAYDIRGTVKDVEIARTFWHIFGAAGQVKYTRNAAAKGIRIDDNGLSTDGFKNTVANSITPDLYDVNSHRVTISGAATINAPTHTATYGGARQLIGGERFTLHIVNTSGGAITPTFNAAYLTVAPSVGSGKRRTVDFQYDTTSSLWAQVGDWSADL